jgi:HAD superfamily phosphoserine phosphatase-like hydrolase
MNSKTTVLSASAKQFLDSVLSLQPKLAAFDCDGTLWSGDAGEGFFDWELKRGLVSDEVVRWARARYAEYQAARVSEDDMCGEMVTLHRGLPEADVIRAAREYFEPNIAPQIFPEIRELVRRLQQSGCDVWAVSSTNEWVIREAMRHFGIRPERILAATVQIRDGIVTERLVRVPSGPGKPKAIREVIKKPPDVAFGNSRWDIEMLKMAKHAFAVNPHPDLQVVAREQGWTIYFPETIERRP